MNIEDTVTNRYSKALQESSPELCCPTSYDPEALSFLPDEIIEKDFGCGDPSRFVQEGDRVLDLGSGGGKICYMAARIVGPDGFVLGVDMNPDMLSLARKYQQEMAEKIGGDRVRFHRGFIQDLALDVEKTDFFLKDHPVRSTDDWLAFQSWQEEQRALYPLIPDNSIDLVVSNCVLNLVRDSEKERMIREIVRVLKPGGRIALSDIVSDKDIPDHQKNDPELWSGCLSGSFREDRFIQVLADAGLQAIRIESWGEAPWQTVEGIEFRSVTLTALKPFGTDCFDQGHAVIYRGPYQEIRDEEGHVFPRGERIAVCERSYRTLMQGPYRQDFIGVPPEKLQDPRECCTPSGTKRSPEKTKNGRHETATPSKDCCSPPSVSGEKEDDHDCCSHTE